MARLSACRRLDGGQKGSYGTRSEAVAAMQRCVQTTGTWPGHLHVYECSECTMWHYGRSRNRFKPTGRRRGNLGAW